VTRKLPRRSIVSGRDGVVLTMGRDAESHGANVDVCSCRRLGPRRTLALDWEVAGAGLEAYGFVTVVERNPWLSLELCERCARCWYVAIDTLRDEIHMVLLSSEEERLVLEGGEWPKTYDGLASVWPER
jgi:hypothetical protein